ncbi:MAG TPA: hypothetical protein VMU68_03605 [Acidimicrobiales bacterium]|nr:hypothetical protein [Acidimicrobiales bacterium]
MRKQTENTFVLSDPSEILHALVGLKDVRVLHYERRGPEVALVIEQVVEGRSLPPVSAPGQVVVHAHGDSSSDCHTRKGRGPNLTVNGTS